MLTTRILVNGFDGQTEGYGVSSGFGSIPSGHVVMVLPREIGVYIDGRGQNPSSGLVSDVLLEKRWGVVDDVWNNHVGADLVPLNPVLVIPGASLTVYMYKEAVGEVRMVAVLAYEYEKVTDEVVVSVRRRGGAAEVF
jgi:hypothetical protein